MGQFLSTLTTPSPTGGIFNTAGFIPLGDALGWHTWLVWLQVMPHVLLGIVCLVVPFLMLLFWPWQALRPRLRWAGIFFCLSCLMYGLGHLSDAAVIWYPAYVLQGSLDVLALGTALVSLICAWPLRHRLWPGAIYATDAIALPLTLPAGKPVPTGALQVQAFKHGLLSESMQDSVEIRQRFESALHSAGITVFSQDRDLRYSWISGPTERPVDDYVGRTDFEVLNPLSSGPIVAIKQKTMATRRAQEADVNYQLDSQHSVWYRLHVDPTYNAEGDVNGVNCVAVDITVMKALEEEQMRLSAELAAALQRYQLAMQSSNVVVFTQDQDLIYTSISKELLGRQPEEFIGLHDEDLLPVGAQNILLPLKKRVLQSGYPEQMEVPVAHNGKTQWLDMYVNPLKDVSGRTVGLTCAALDITERKGWEEHLRLLMRELTHRSKNLLAVIQAMARQTARHVDDVDKFVERFSARLQALGGAHDLLVRESWHGVNMPDLIASQLGHYADLAGTQVMMDGPEVFMAPEAAQNLGMALHEMATNAAKYGALSTPRGHVDILWRWQEPTGEETEKRLVLDWQEKDGPPAQKPERVGFGTHVIERNIIRSLNAKVELKYEKKGFAAHMEIPLRSLMIKSSPIEQLTEPRAPREQQTT